MHWPAFVFCNWVPSFGHCRKGNCACDKTILKNQVYTFQSGILGPLLFNSGQLCLMELSRLVVWTQGLNSCQECFDWLGVCCNWANPSTVQNSSGRLTKNKQTKKKVTQEMCWRECSAVEASWSSSSFPPAGIPWSCFVLSKCCVKWVFCPEESLVFFLGNEWLSRKWSELNWITWWPLWLLLRFALKIKLWWSMSEFGKWSLLFTHGGGSIHSDNHHTLKCVSRVCQNKKDFICHCYSKCILFRYQPYISWLNKSPGELFPLCHLLFLFENPKSHYKTCAYFTAFHIHTTNTVFHRCDIDRPESTGLAKKKVSKI